MAVIFQFKRGKSTSFTSKNLLLSAGEPGYELDTGKLKIGDGVTKWNDLAYINDDCITVQGDGVSIVVENNIVSLAGFPEAKKGYSIRKTADGKLEWFEPAEQTQIQSLLSVIEGKADASKVYTKEEIDQKVNSIFTGLPEHLDTLKEITEWITADTMAMIQMQTKVNSIENGAQVNKIEHIKVGDSELSIVDKMANIPVASATAYGVVKTSTGANKVTLDDDGILEVDTLGVEKLRNFDCELILQGGNAQI